MRLRFYMESEPDPIEVRYMEHFFKQEAQVKGNELVFDVECLSRQYVLNMAVLAAIWSDCEYYSLEE